ncbi:MAG: hypothetical protein ACRECH_16825 [Nitrososphaerales archaeon]
MSLSQNAAAALGHSTAMDGGSVAMREQKSAMPCVAQGLPEQKRRQNAAHNEVMLSAVVLR